MLRRALAPLYGGRLVGLRLRSSGEDVKASLRALGLNREIVIDEVSTHEDRSLAGQYLRQFTSIQRLIHSHLHNGYPGFALYDSVLKAELIGSCDIKSELLHDCLSQAILFQRQYEAVFDAHEIRAVIVSHPTTLRFSTLVWTALSRSVPVFKINYQNEHLTLCRLGSRESFYMPYDVPDPECVRALPSEVKAKLSRIGRDYLGKLRQNKVGDYTGVGIYRGQAMSREELTCTLNLDPDKPNVVVFTNCWPDFPNGQGPTYFTDYEAWFYLTLEVIESESSCNWIIKPHPAENWYGDRVSLRTLLQDRRPSGLALWPDGLSSKSVLNFADCVVTARGSAGIEYPACGLPAIVAAPTNYSGWDFASVCRSRESYQNLLRIAGRQPKPTARQQTEAQLFVGLTYCSASDVDPDGYRFPLGSLSYKLWPGLPRFVWRYRSQIEREISLMREWASTENGSYSIYKYLNWAT